jgi:hypothetical protein
MRCLHMNLWHLISLSLLVTGDLAWMLAKSMLDAGALCQIAVPRIFPVGLKQRPTYGPLNVKSEAQGKPCSVCETCYLPHPTNLINLRRNGTSKCGC